MKRFINSTAVIIPMVAAMFFSTSCIYDAPGDRFYRTLWKSSPEPFAGLFPLTYASDEAGDVPSSDTRCSFGAAGEETLEEDCTSGTAGEGITDGGYSFWIAGEGISDEGCSFGTAGEGISDEGCSFGTAGEGILDADCSSGTAGPTATMAAVRFTSEVAAPNGIGAITVEFLCDRKITVKNTSGTTIAHGTYTPDGTTATLTDLTFYLGDTRLTLTQAHRNGDTLFLQWQTSTNRTTRTTSLDRLSAYE